MKNKLIGWSIKILVICFVVYGFIYHTYIMFFIIFLLVGLIYSIIKYGQKIFDMLKNIKKP